MVVDTPHIGIVTISDRASSGIYQDRSGPAIRETLKSFLSSPWEECYRLIPDDKDIIEATLKSLCDDEGCCLVLTTGGTGPSPRDLTPDATAAVCTRVLDGFGECMRATSLRYVPTAILSRQIAGLRNASLIVNLPGKPHSIRTCMEAVFPAIPYCIELAGGPSLFTNETIIKAFRPKN
jgi:molybdopterin adenylyltransferase